MGNQSVGKMNNGEGDVIKGALAANQVIALPIRPTARFL